MSRTQLVEGLLMMISVTLCCWRATGEEFQQIVDFRDGTILKLDIPQGLLPWRRISEVGEITDEPIRMADIEHLRLVVTPATEQVAQIRRLIAQLGADSYHAREEAHIELIQRGVKFRKILEQSLAGTTDDEVRWRLREIVKALPEGEGLWGNDYDQLMIKGNSREIQGDIGQWSLDVSYRGATLTLNRANVLAIRHAPLDLDLSAEPPIAHVERILDDNDSNFPSDVTRIDFDRGPDGESLAAGTDITETFVPLGCTFSTSFADSYVAIEPYNVGGRSGGRCAATHRPLYQGVMTIRFCKPGNARLAAGVRYIGFWTSHVAMDGTSLQAFDARGRMIAAIKTVKNQRDFLALTSNVPIAFIYVVPNLDIDPDYAIDDLVFDTPKPLSESGDPDRFSIVLATGERLYSAAIEKEGEMVRMKQVTIGVDELKVFAAEIAVLVPPRAPLAQDAGDQRCFVRLVDGTVLRGRSQDGLRLDRFDQLPLDAHRLVALWGAETTLLEPAEDAWPQQGALLIGDNLAEPLVLADWKLGKDWIEADNLPAGSAAGTASTYANSPVIWFQKPTKRPPGSGLLRTVSGEEIVLGAPNGFELKSWSLAGVTIANGDHQWTLGLNEVRSLLMPR